VIRLPSTRVADLAARHGGAARGDALALVDRMAPLREAGEGALAPLLRAAKITDAIAALARGASLLVDASLDGAFAPSRAPRGGALWVHAHAAWAMACVLDGADAPDEPARVGEGSTIGAHAVLGPRVVVGRDVRIGAGAVIGSPGFGWATGPDGVTRAVPQLGGVVIEDGASIGPLSTVDAGTLAPTRVRRGAKLDAHVHVGHNVDIGEGCVVAAQAGFAGSVTLGRGVLVGGQAGFADHVTVGDGAKIAAKSGVIGDIAAGAVVAGYPAVPRLTWLRALAWSYRAARRHHDE